LEWSDSLIMNYKHGKCGSPTYSSWGKLLGRTTCTTNKQYKDYGGRGITVCDEWKDFRNFLSDMGEKPEGKSIERINNDKGYHKENCKWATPREQAENRRSSNLVTGVSWREDKKRWRAYTSKSNNKCRSLGNFIDFFEAVCARKSWELL